MGLWNMSEVRCVTVYAWFLSSMMQDNMIRVIFSAERVWRKEDFAPPVSAERGRWATIR